MTLQRLEKRFTFSDGREIIAHEANWDIATERSTQETTAKAERAKGPDSETLFFRETIYPHLGPCSTGQVPNVEESLRISDADLDGWYDAVRQVNPDWFPQNDVAEEDIIFRDGSKITIKPVNRPSVLLKLFRLETQADQTQSNSQNASAEVFRILYYPKMSACSFGDVPTMESARQDMPESELNKWYNAVRRVNPSLFLSLEEIAEKNQAAALSTEKKSKKPRKRS